MRYAYGLVEAEIDLDLVRNSTGKYIRFQGNGILDGLNLKKNKVSFWKIVGVGENEEILLKKYRSKLTYLLPKHEQAQKSEIIELDEYKNLPIY